MKQEMMGWHWHQLDHMQIIRNSLQTDNHASTLSLNFFTGQMLFLMPNQQYQSTEASNDPTEKNKFKNQNDILKTTNFILVQS